MLAEIFLNIISKIIIKYSITSLKHSNENKQKEIEHIQIGKDEIKLPLCANNMILYIENPKISPKNY